jgi:hypothetical protein
MGSLAPPVVVAPMPPAKTQLKKKKALDEADEDLKAFRREQADKKAAPSPSPKKKDRAEKPAVIRCETGVEVTVQSSVSKGYKTMEQSTICALEHDCLHFVPSLLAEMTDKWIRLSSIDL